MCEVKKKKKKKRKRKKALVEEVEKVRLYVTLAQREG